MGRRDPNRERLRARQACRNCRKKKARCPSEKPACSTCIRLNQPCVYDGTRTPDRLTDLEKKVDLILNSKQRRSDHLDEDLARESPPGSFNTSTQMQTGTDIEAPSAHHSSRGPSCSGYRSLSPRTEFRLPKLNISQSDIVRGLDTYFERFHRQPIWCFNRQEVGHNTEVSRELIYSILELTARFTRSHPRDHDAHSYGESARWSIMLRVASDTVELETIESLCLLSYSAFIDGDMQPGQFYLGLGFQLYRSGRLDRWPIPLNASHTSEREKRLFWSLQSLEQFYGDLNGILRTAPEVWRPFYLSDNIDIEFPPEATGTSPVSGIGVWSLSVHFGWIWSRVREYVSECSRNKLVEPWRLDSTYAKVLADMTEIENKAPLGHRYDVVKFHERRPDEVQLDRDYWMPWLKLQFIWHSILTMINHPFLYIAASQRHPNLAIPNTFWRKSSELVLLHATWIVRTIDMAQEKRANLLDPFFGHAAAIAATVHLYFFCAADLRLRQKSKTDYTKCQQFLQSFSAFSPACESLTRLLDKITRIALGSENIDYEWAPSRIQLSIPLMWKVLQFEISSSKAASTPSDILPPTSPTLSDVVGEIERDQTLEISVTATPPAVTIDPALGHDARLPPYKASLTFPQAPSQSEARNIVVPPVESFMVDTPWLWTHPSGSANVNDGPHFPPNPATDNSSDGFSTWWNFGNL